MAPGRFSVGGSVFVSYTGRCHSRKLTTLVMKLSAAACTTVSTLWGIRPPENAALDAGTNSALPIGRCPFRTVCPFHWMWKPVVGWVYVPVPATEGTLVEVHPLTSFPVVSSMRSPDVGNAYVKPIGMYALHASTRSWMARIWAVVAASKYQFI